MMRLVAVCLLLAGAAHGQVVQDQGAQDRQDLPVRLHAAGSLRPAMTEMARAYAAAGGGTVVAEFGASGLLRGRLERGEAGDVFASADMGNPLALAVAGRSGPVVLFARNRLCAITRPGLRVAPAGLLAAMLAPGTRLGTSTPGNDPAGDYAWRVFARAGAVRPGAEGALQAKALRLTGTPGQPMPPEGRSVYAWHILEGRADLFLAYCTAAREALAEAPDLGVVELPPELAVGADYGITALHGGDARAALGFVMFVLSRDGQAVLARHGFDAPLAGP